MVDIYFKVWYLTFRKGDSLGFFEGYGKISYCHVPEMLKKGKEVSY